MLMRLEFETCLSNGAEGYIYGLDNLHCPSNLINFFSAERIRREILDNFPHGKANEDSDIAFMGCLVFGLCLIKHWTHLLMILGTNLWP